MAKGYCFNNPIEIVDNAISLDTIAKFDSKNIVIETIKVAEDNNGIIVRAYECFGQNAKSTLNLNFNATDIYECDMLETKKNLPAANLSSLLRLKLKLYTWVLKNKYKCAKLCMSFT